MDDAKLTRDERNVLGLLAGAWNLYVGLKDATDVTEFRDGIHRAQTVIALRVARRADPGIWTDGLKAETREDSVVERLEAAIEESSGNYLAYRVLDMLARNNINYPGELTKMTSNTACLENYGPATHGWFMHWGHDNGVHVPAWKDLRKPYKERR